MDQMISSRTQQIHLSSGYSDVMSPGLRAGKFLLIFAMTVLIGILSFFYLVKFTEIHTKGYQLRKLEIERSRLVSMMESKNMNIARLKTLGAVEESSIMTNMVKMRNPIFVMEDSNIAQLPSQ